MTKIYRALLALIAIIFGIISIASLFWWAPYAFFLLSGDIGVNITRKEWPPELIASVSDTQIFIYQFREYFSALGGIFGWIALIKLCTIANRNFSEIPKWVLFGVLTGIIAALIIPIGIIMLSLAPIVTSITLLIRSKFTIPNNTINKDNLLNGQNSPIE